MVCTRRSSRVAHSADAARFGVSGGSEFSCPRAVDHISPPDATLSRSCHSPGPVSVTPYSPSAASRVASVRRCSLKRLTSSSTAASVISTEHPCNAPRNWPHSSPPRARHAAWWPPSAPQRPPPSSRSGSSSSVPCGRSGTSKTAPAAERRRPAKLRTPRSRRASSVLHSARWACTRSAKRRTASEEGE